MKKSNRFQRLFLKTTLLSYFLFVSFAIADDKGIEKLTFDIKVDSKTQVEVRCHLSHGNSIDSDVYQYEKIEISSHSIPNHSLPIMMEDDFVRNYQFASLVRPIDINLDGHNDLAVYGQCGSKPYMCIGSFYLYSPKLRKFEFSLEFSDLLFIGESKIDKTSRTITKYLYSGCAGRCYEESTYKLDKNGSPVKIKMVKSERAEVTEKSIQLCDDITRSKKLEFNKVPECVAPEKFKVVTILYENGKEVSNTIEIKMQNINDLN